MSEYFSKPFSKSLWENMKVELDLSDYATQGYLKNATCVDTSHFDKNTDLSILKTKIGKLDIVKLKTAVVNLSKTSDAGQNEVVKYTLYNELPKKVNAVQNTDTGNLV